MRERRAKVGNQGIRQAVKEVREKFGLDPREVDGMGNSQVQQAAQLAWKVVDSHYPIMMDDDKEAHLEALSTITQDESEDSIVRSVARFRQDQFFQWIAQQQQAQADAAATAAQAGVKPTKEEGKPAPRRGGGGGGGGGRQRTDPHGGTQSSEAMNTPRSEGAALTRAAQGGAVA